MRQLEIYMAKLVAATYRRVLAIGAAIFGESFLFKVFNEITGVDLKAKMEARDVEFYDVSDEVDLAGDSSIRWN